MKHLILAITILAAGTSQAQEATKCLALTKVKLEHHLLHQQDENLAELTFKAHKCYVLEGPEKPGITFAAEPGLYVFAKDVRFTHEEAQTGGGTKEVRVSVKLLASDTIPVGEHQVRGIVNYQTAGAEGTIAPESLAISIPFKVAPPRPPARKNGFVKGLKSTGMVLAEIALVPIFLVWMLVYCPISGDCPTC
jgi:hypothetical protein